jgi:hypothetical protein
MTFMAEAVSEDPTSEMALETPSVRDCDNRDVPAQTAGTVVDRADGLLGDFDGDGDIDFVDYTTFVWCCNQGEPCGDLVGPITGEHPSPPPWSACNYPYGPDGQCDFEDLVVFAIMFNWSQSQQGLLTALAMEGAEFANAAGSWDQALGHRLEAEPSLAGPGRVSVGEQFSMVLDPVDLSDIVALRLRLDYDPTTFAFEGTNLDEILSHDPNQVVGSDGGGPGYVDIVRAVLGSRVTHSAAQVELRFRALREDAEARIRISEIELRSASNQDLLPGIDPERFSIPLPVSSELPVQYRLGQNAPNPFLGSTRVRFDLPQAEHVELRIYDVAGRLVRELASGPFPAGSHEIEWDGRGERGYEVMSGIYFYELHTGPFRDHRRMLRAR